MAKKFKKQNQPENQERDTGGMMFREAAFDIETRAEGEPALVRMTVSSEAPVLTYAYYNREYQRVYEILDHSPGSIDMSRCRDGLVIQDGHYGDQIGLMAVAVEGRKLGGAVEFCSGARAQEIMQDAIKKLRRNTSVGYRVDADSYVLEGEKDGIPVVRAMSWMPYEASFVPVPADTQVGVGRSQQQSNIPSKGVSIMSEENKNARNLTGEDVVEIYRLARAFNMEPGAADEHVKSDKPVDEFRSLALKKAETDKAEMQRKIDEGKNTKAPPAKRADDPANGIFSGGEEAQVAKRFSVMNVLRYLDALRNGNKPTVDIGYEREVSDEMAKRAGKPAQGMYLPHCANVLMKRGDPFLKTGNGSNFVATNLLVGQFIDALRSKMVLNDAGVTTLSGLVGDIAIPKGGAITGGWVDGENGAGTEGKPTVTQVTGTPKTASGWTDISRRLMLQSGIDVEAFVQNELFNTIARLIEVAAFAGTNANGQPKGLKSQDGVNNPNVTANAATRAELIGFLTAILADNADFPNKSWIMRPEGAGLLRGLPDGILTNVLGTENVSTFGMGPLLKDEGRLIGYPVHETTNIAAHHVFFGAWSQMVIGLWSGIDLLVDPYTNSTSGATRIVALQDADIMVRNGQAFAYNAALTA